MTGMAISNTLVKYMKVGRAERCAVLLRGRGYREGATPRFLVRRERRHATQHVRLHQDADLGPQDAPCDDVPSRYLLRPPSAAALRRAYASGQPRVAGQLRTRVCKLARPLHSSGTRTHRWSVDETADHPKQRHTTCVRTYICAIYINIQGFAKAFLRVV